MGQGKRSAVYAKPGCNHGTAQDGASKPANRQTVMCTLRYALLSQGRSKQGGEKISKWVCSGKIKNGASSCPSRAIYESEIKPIIEDIFKSGQQHIEELSACVLKLVSEVLDTNENKDELNRLNQELITRQKMKAKLLQYNADGRMDDSEFIRMTADCDNEIKDIEKKINALNKTSKTE